FNAPLATGERRCSIAGMSTIAMRAACAFACFASVLHAQRPGPTLKQLDHKAWTIRDGAPPNVVALAQSADGVLWIGTQSGLYRFDGVRFEEFDPAAGQSLPSHFITALLAVPDGSMWIGYVRSEIGRASCREIGGSSESAAA